MPIPNYATLSINDQPLVDSWSMPSGAYRAPTSTDMEGGNVRLRRQPGDEMYELQFDILFTAAEFATFKTFVQTTLGGGVSRFTMNVWTGAAMETKTVQFVQPYVPTPLPPVKTAVSFHLRVYP